MECGNFFSADHTDERGLTFLATASCRGVQYQIIPMLKRLPLWMGLVGAGSMIVAIRLVALRAIFYTNYIGLQLGILLPPVRQEPSMLDVWILNAWIVLTGAAEFALIGLLLRLAIARFTPGSNIPSPNGRV
jgi:hypothetical protein